MMLLILWHRILVFLERQVIVGFSGAESQTINSFVNSVLLTIKLYNQQYTHTLPQKEFEMKVSYFIFNSK